MADTEVVTRISRPHLPEIPGFEVQSLLGQGGMAEVYLALDEDFFKRPVALKILNLSKVQNDSMAERFLEEAKAVGELEHPHIIPVYRAGQTEEYLYLAMQLLKGGSLEDRLKKETLKLSEVITLGREIAGALGHAHKHRQEIIHRDVKPANILFDDAGNPMLADFGIARRVSAPSGHTLGFAIGTPPYMAPEQMAAEKLDGRCDLYALGWVLYESLTGSHPYNRLPYEKILSKKISEPPPSLPKQFSKLQPIFEKLVASRNEDRYANADELVAALDELQTTESKASRITTWVLAAALVGVSTVGAFYYQHTLSLIHI